MKKTMLLLFILYLLLLNAFSKEEFEIGLSYTPVGAVKNHDVALVEQMVGATDAGGNFFSNNIIGFHCGYNFWWLLYGSMDSYAMPPWWVMENRGVYKPGFLTYLDVGIRPRFGDLMLMAELGLNYIYLYKGREEQTESIGIKPPDDSIGVNLRIGIGWALGDFSINLLGTSIFADFNKMAETMKAIANEDRKAFQQFTDTLIPSIAVYYFF